MERVGRLEQAGAVKFFITTINVSSVLEWLVAILYIIVILLVSSNYGRRLWECVVTHLCRMDATYVTKSM
jgi:hypothetical protein